MKVTLIVDFDLATGNLKLERVGVDKANYTPVTFIYAVLPELLAERLGKKLVNAERYAEFLE